MSNLHQSVLQKKDLFGRCFVMVCTEISAQGNMDLHVNENSTITADRYVNGISDFMNDNIQLM
jgi:hypothetical protein